MLSYVDCLGLSELSEAEVEAVAEHEHIPEIVAAELGCYLVQSAEGVPMLKAIFLDDIRAAQTRRNTEKVRRLNLVLRHFIDTHPEKQSA